MFARKPGKWFVIVDKRVHVIRYVSCLRLDAPLKEVFSIIVPLTWLDGDSAFRASMKARAFDEGILQ
jgi:hypothetical protein